MAIIVLFLCFISIFFSLAIGYHSRVTTKEKVLRSVLVFSLVVVLITEITSAFHLLNYRYILLCWLGILVLNAFYLYFKKEFLIEFIAKQKELIRYKLGSLKRRENVILLSVVVIVILVFIQGLVYPPNNWDSMTYHLSRIIHWISNESVAHYPTNIPRQLYQPPFTEFVLMNLNILNGGDYFSNSVQLFFLIASLSAILLITGQFGLSGKYGLLAIALVITIPEVILQASSTQNDIVLSFFILTSVYFGYKSIKELSLANYFYFGLSIGLGVLTKGTSYIYLTPIIIFFATAVILRFFFTRNGAYFGYSFFVIGLFIVINSGHFLRNYQFNRTLFGMDKSESKTYSNENMTPTLFLSNLVKNAGLQIAPFPINLLTDKIIVRLHELVGVNINHPWTTYRNLKYQGSANPVGEDTAANPVHFILVISSFLLIGIQLFKSRIHVNKQIAFIALIILQGFLFCLLLRWQPWHTRLHTPFFFLSIPVICYAASISNRFSKVTFQITPLIILYALIVVLLNTSRPYISTPFTTKISIMDDRYKKYFANRLYLYEEYNGIQEKLKSTEKGTIGLIMSGDQWEYPLFNQAYKNGLHPVHVMVSNFTKSCPSEPVKVNYMISTTLKDEMVLYQGRQFYNLNRENQFIWFYE